MGTVSAEDMLLARTGRLFANPSLITGMVKMLDLGATFDVYNTDATPKEADYWSILSDWYAIGDDLRYALTDYEAQLSK